MAGETLPSLEGKRGQPLPHRLTLLETSGDFQGQGEKACVLGEQLLPGVIGVYMPLAPGPKGQRTAPFCIPHPRLFRGPSPCPQRGLAMSSVTAALTEQRTQQSPGGRGSDSTGQPASFPDLLV